MHANCDYRIRQGGRLCARLSKQENLNKQRYEKIPHPQVLAILVVISTAAVAQLYDIQISASTEETR